MLISICGVVVDATWPSSRGALGMLAHDCMMAIAGQGEFVFRLTIWNAGVFLRRIRS